MQDPSGLVAPQLLPHLHLISAFRYPQHFKVDIPKASEYLRTAPSIINEHRPVSWTYLTPPASGAVFLEWAPPNRPVTHFPSDGYSWIDMERTHRVDIEGYTIEIFFHNAGINLEVKMPTLMTRYRTRLVAKNAGVAGEEPDPSLWIVFYCQSEIPAQVPPNLIASRPDIQQLFHDRKLIERMGVLTRKEFMFKDRSAWPTIPFPNPTIPAGAGSQMSPTQAASGGEAGAPNGMAPPLPPQHPAMAAQYFQAAQGVAARSGMDKRGDAVAVAGGPVAQAGAPSGGGGARSAVEPAGVDEAALIKGAEHVAASTLRDEETSAAIGDVLDHLTPRDISVMRYMRHHEWLEEVLGSPFPMKSIVAVDLGLGLAGSLKCLTDGLLHVPGAHTVEPVPVPRRDGGAGMVVPPLPVTGKIGPGTAEEVERRVKQFVEEGEEELRLMREEHRKKMMSIRPARVYTRAEKRLRDLYHGEAEEVKGGSAGQDETGSGPGVDVFALAEETAAAVERVLGARICARDELGLVRRGGMIDGEDPNGPFRREQEQEAAAMWQYEAAAAVVSPGVPPARDGAGREGMVERQVATATTTTTTTATTTMMVDVGGTGGVGGNQAGAQPQLGSGVQSAAGGGSAAASGSNSGVFPSPT